MRTHIVAALVLVIGSNPVAAATMQPEEVMNGNSSFLEGNIIQLTLNLIQQISIPITVNQALAIAVNSQNVIANAETTVISINETTSYLIDFINVAGLGQPLDLPFLNELLAALEIPGFNPNPPAGPIVPTQPDDGLPGSGGDTPAPIPLPAALPLSLAGLTGLGLIGWRRRA